MPKLTQPPKLTDVTTNKLYPAYKTSCGTIIQLNGTNTHLPTGQTLEALVTFVDETGLATVIITGGSEPTGHSQNSFHSINRAIDVAGTQFNNLTHAQAHAAAKTAGFTHGVYEDFKRTGRDHWHFQIGAGNGLGDKHSLQHSSLQIKNY